MTVDSSKIQYYTGYNTYKNLGVRSASVLVSGVIAAGTAADYTTTISLEANYKFSTARVRTTDFVGGSPRWQAFPPSVYYDVPTSAGPVSSLQVFLALDINGNQLSFKAFAFNPEASDVTFSSTTIDFVYAVHTTAI